MYAKNVDVSGQINREVRLHFGKGVTLLMELTKDGKSWTRQERWPVQRVCAEHNLKIFGVLPMITTSIVLTKASHRGFFYTESLRW